MREDFEKLEDHREAFFVRAGLFKDVDIMLCAHVWSDFSTSWGQPEKNSGLVSVQYFFHGRAAHSANEPWSGRSALDAVELMNIGWNYREVLARAAEALL